MESDFNSPVRTLAAWFPDDICVMQEYLENKLTSLQTRGTP